MSGGQLNNTALAIIFFTLYFGILILVLLAAYYFSIKVNTSFTLNIEQDEETAEHNVPGTSSRLNSSTPDPIAEPEYAEVKNVFEEPKPQPILAEPEYAMVDKAKKKSKKKTSTVSTGLGTRSLAQDTEISEYATVQF
ncbi:uncharacterized protein LOC116287352 [Actinia tenebrosa]|uniref:Uncharacterized protein LOC116287352 n=1 Tax=Actinia tenebrosa TaxID=6105 RepID=A0A6P8H2Q9_ACTTE|nr:uncharacterized protein LOC116287352 [Actinia tenebrosa]